MIPFNKILIFASMSPHSSLLETLRFQTVGFILVIAALSLIALILISMGYFFKNSVSRKPAAVAGVTPREKPSDTAREDDPEVILAVIAAAVDSVISNSHRIVSIRPVDAGQASGNLYLQAWSIEGRRQHFASHKIR
ncbi:MAG TPA: OadG family protein [Candidatus Wunengus sp. YC60]|uniref:OadG family protein n=1 Tax=Candidatus Wunengus sp. YC60 TaxID=3367697 RepID=UPI0040278261